MTAAEELARNHPPRQFPRVWVTRIRELRREKGLTLKTVSGGLGISLGYLHQIEQGRVNPSLTVACRLAAFFGLPVEQVWVRRAGPHDQVAK